MPMHGHIGLTVLWLVVLTGLWCWSLELCPHGEECQVGNYTAIIGIVL